MTRKLQDQTRFTEDLIEFNPNPIFRKDTAGRFVVVNQAWEQLSGRKRADVPQTVAELFGERVLIEWCGVKEMLLDHIGHFSGFAGESECCVGELLFVCAIAAECARSELLIFVELHGVA